MSQIVLDEQLIEEAVLTPIKHWITVQPLHRLRPGEVIKDERVPMLLRTLYRPTFVTIDGWFWNRELSSPRYCILWFALSDERQRELPNLLRRLLRLPEFRTRAARMGKVARVSFADVVYWQLDDERLRRLA